MLDIKYFRENPKPLITSEITRGHGRKFVDDVIKHDNEWRKALKKVEQLKAKRNAVTKEISQFKKQGKNADSKIKEMKNVAADIQKQDTKVNDILKKRDKARAEVGNPLDPQIPQGKDDSENVPVKFWGKKPKFDFPLRDHIELGEMNDLFEFDTAAKAAGARFYYLKNEAVSLAWALQNFAMDYLRKNGFNMVWPPLMLNRAALAGGVNLSEFTDTIYKIEGEDLYLIGTSEHPLVAMKKDQVLTEDQLPVKLGGISPCFRKELGAHGRDDKGIYRVHQFNKVEQIMYTLPKNSPKAFKVMQRNAEKLFEALGIPYRVVVICTGDLGNKQSLQYDIEAWMPGQKNKKGAYREVTSCSNCLSYQAESLNTKYLDKKTGNKEYVHMLNNTAITDRAIIPILENNQQKDGSIKIPKALWKYTGFKVIKPKKK
jgi:seryl-tRNA synthetase